MVPDLQTVRSLICDTVVALCSTGVTYHSSLTIQGVVGVTVDDGNVLLVHIDRRIDDDQSNYRIGWPDSDTCCSAGQDEPCDFHEDRTENTDVNNVNVCNEQCSNLSSSCSKYCTVNQQESFVTRYEGDEVSANTCESGSVCPCCVVADQQQQEQRLQQSVQQLQQLQLQLAQQQTQLSQQLLQQTEQLQPEQLQQTEQLQPEQQTEQQTQHLPVMQQLTQLLPVMQQLTHLNQLDMRVSKKRLVNGFNSEIECSCLESEGQIGHQQLIHCKESVMQTDPLSQKPAQLQHPSRLTIDPPGSPVDSPGPGSPLDPHGPPVDVHGPPVDPHGPPVDPHGPPVDPHGPPVDPHGPPVGLSDCAESTEISQLDPSLSQGLDNPDLLEPPGSESLGESSKQTSNSRGATCERGPSCERRPSCERGPVCERGPTPDRGLFERILDSLSNTLPAELCRIAWERPARAPVASSSHISIQSSSSAEPDTCRDESGVNRDVTEGSEDRMNGGVVQGLENGSQGNIYMDTTIALSNQTEASDSGVPCSQVQQNSILIYSDHSYLCMTDSTQLVTKATTDEIMHSQTSRQSPVDSDGGKVRCKTSSKRNSKPDHVIVNSSSDEILTTDVVSASVSEEIKSSASGQTVNKVSHKRKSTSNVDKDESDSIIKHSAAKSTNEKTKLEHTAQNKKIKVENIFKCSSKSSHFQFKVKIPALHPIKNKKTITESDLSNMSKAKSDLDASQSQVSAHELTSACSASSVNTARSKRKSGAINSIDSETAKEASCDTSSSQSSESVVTSVDEISPSDDSSDHSLTSQSSSDTTTNSSSAVTVYESYEALCANNQFKGSDGLPIKMKLAYVLLERCQQTSTQRMDEIS